MNTNLKTNESAREEHRRLQATQAGEELLHAPRLSVEVITELQRAAPIIAKRVESRIIAKMMVDTLKHPADVSA